MVVAAEPTRGALSWRDDDGGAGSAVALPEALGLNGSLNEWALRWAWDDPAISTVVCDLPDASSLARFLDLADSVEPGGLSVRELTTLNRVRDHYVKARPASCPACRTCMPCPEGIDIPRILDLGNDASVYGGVENARATYLMEQQRAADCTACALCEEACPRDVPIISRLEQARDLFD
jgi:predicted aldo/keto reductase-like oxidoreductase